MVVVALLLMPASAMALFKKTWWSRIGAMDVWFAVFRDTGNSKLRFDADLYKSKRWFCRSYNLGLFIKWYLPLHSASRGSHLRSK